MQVIPAMDLIDGAVVRLEQGDFSRKTVYATDPIAVAQTFKDAGLTRLHIVDLSGAKAKEPFHGRLIADIKKATGVSIQAGGGIRSLDQVEKLFQESLSKDEDSVMIGSLPFKDSDEFNRILEKFADNILLTVDVWGRSIRISGWQEDTAVDLNDFLEEQLNNGLNYFLVTQIQKDGMLSGPDFQLYEEILDKFPGIRLVASGGIAQIDDFTRLRKLDGLHGAILGKAFYVGNIKLNQLK